MKQRATVLGIVMISSGAAHLERRANFVHITVTATSGVPVRAIWRPRSGVIGASVADQQAPLTAFPGSRASTDSTRRWRDPSARDTVVAQTPVQFVVDMTSNTVVIEAVRPDSVHVEVQLTPARGPIARGWGRAFHLQSDGRAPTLERIR